MIAGISATLSALRAAETQQAVTANNIANLLTPGFKSRRVELESRGDGVAVGAVSASQAQGPLALTGNPLDLAVQGGGYFAIEKPDGTQALTRAGNFRISADGTVVTPDGYRVTGFPPAPPGTTGVNLSPNGTGTFQTPGGPVNFQVPLARVANPQGLRSVGGNLLEATPASGQIETGTAGGAGFGWVVSGAQELSNVDIIEQMVSLIEVKAAYMANLKALGAADEMAAVAIRWTRGR